MAVSSSSKDDDIMNFDSLSPPPSSPSHPPPASLPAPSLSSPPRPSSPPPLLSSSLFCFLFQADFPRHGKGGLQQFYALFSNLRNFCKKRMPLPEKFQLIFWVKILSNCLGHLPIAEPITVVGSVGYSDWSGLGLEDIWILTD